MLEESVKCTIEDCDIFDFMATHVGFTVLHPGGLQATHTLADACQIGPNTKVIDIACGKGTSAIFLAQNYGCRVVGVDISDELIAEGRSLVSRRGVSHLVELEQGDALDLPFADDEFDAAVSQAMLVLVKDKRKAIEEALRVTRPGGYVAWNELSWREEPTEWFLEQVSTVICAYCMLNVHTYKCWRQLFHEAGVRDLKTLEFPMEFNAWGGMLADEGIVNTGRIMLRFLANGRVRKRMNTMDRFFKENAHVVGYGIYFGMS
jgi:SAM-dependent methyltransferase